MTNLAKFYLDPRGRVSRKAFWLGFVLVAIALECVVGTAEATWQSIRTGENAFTLYFGFNLAFPIWAPLTGLSLETPFRSLGALLWFWPQVALFIKRLHDINRSAIWFAALVAASAWFQLLAWVGHRSGWMFSDSGAALPLWYVLSALAFLLGFLTPLLLACIPGSRGTNRFGLDPRPISAAAETPLATNANTPAPSV